jgi:hypothetical protein
VTQFGANAYGEILEPGRVPDCYVGLLLRAGDPDQAPSVLVVSPAAFLHPGVCQPDGTLVYELVTGHPNRAPRELVFLADLSIEQRAWLADTWAKVWERLNSELEVLVLARRVDRQTRLASDVVDALRRRFEAELLEHDREELNGEEDFPSVATQLRPGRRIGG